MVRRILTLPEDETVLRQRSVKVKRLDQATRDVIQDLKDTFARERAYGLSAPQIGVLRRIILFRGDKEEEPPMVLMNPKILRADGEEKDYDGCLSIPGIYGRTRRAARIVVVGQDEHGEDVRLKLSDFTARVAQHEIDHLDGILFIDRIDSLDDLYALERQEGEEEAVERFRRMLPAIALTW
jgi:peptide deformylase